MQEKIGRGHVESYSEITHKSGRKSAVEFSFEDIPKMIPEKPRFYDKAKADKARDSLMAMMKGKGALQ